MFVKWAYPTKIPERKSTIIYTNFMLKPFQVISGLIICLLLLSRNDVNAQSTVNVGAAIQEAYGNYVPKITEKQMAGLNKQFARCEVKKVDRQTAEQLPLLSSVPVMNKFVTNLQADDFTQQPLKINPFKYMINFTLTEDQTFRIDGTDYVLFVKGIK